MIQTAAGIITLPSHYSVTETLDRLALLLREKAITVFSRIDHAAEAEKVHLAMLPTQLLIFGNPGGGTPIMLSAPLSAIDLPIKALAWQDADGAVWLSYNDPDLLHTRFDVPEALLTPVRALNSLILQATT